MLLNTSLFHSSGKTMHSLVEKWPESCVISNNLFELINIREKIEMKNGPRLSTQGNSANQLSERKHISSPVLCQKIKGMLVYMDAFKSKGMGIKDSFVCQKKKIAFIKYRLAV